MSTTTISRRLALVAPTIGMIRDGADGRRVALETVERVRAMLPGTDIVVASSAPQAFEGAGARVIAASDAGALIAAAIGASVLVLGPVELRTEDAAATVDVRIGDHASALAFAAGLAGVAAVFERPLWVLGASVRGRAEDAGGGLVRAVFEVAQHAAVRDEESRVVLSTLGINRNAITIDTGGDLGWEPGSGTSAGAASAETRAFLERVAPRVRTELSSRYEELERELARRARALEERDAVIIAREEEVARLRSVVASLDAELGSRGLAVLETELAEIKTSRAWRTLTRYRLLRARVRAFRERRVWHPPPYPKPLDESSKLRLELPRKHDVVCFSIIDWEDRWQRPQQIASKFADNGHRVFYVRMSAFLAPGGKPYEITALRDNVWAVELATRMHPRIYERPIDAPIVTALADSLSRLRSQHDIALAVALVQLPTWHPVAEAVRDEFGWRIVYDCMDDWHDFPGVAELVIGEEQSLVRSADLVTVSAQGLFEKWANANDNVVLARNATDFKRFATGITSDEPDGLAPPVLGYFGAIAEWFDVELVSWLAQKRPEYTFVLIGGVSVDVKLLKRCSNVQMLGHRPYDEIPAHLARFDVCLIPFRVNKTTAAADQVKFYEYISQGKPIVSTWLPELEFYREHLYMAENREEFLEALDHAVVEDDPLLRQQRVALARANDWQSRYDAIEGAIAALLPMLSVVVVTYENLDLTRQCIDSLRAGTTQPRFEIIAVDNGSTDGTSEYLRELSTADDRVRVVLNEDNRGFAAAVNQGLQLASGDVLVILNNDVVVPNSWHAPLLRHLERPDIGLVMASTNVSANESRIPVSYDNLGEMETFAAARRWDHDGRAFDIRVAIMFCVAFRRDVYEQVGDLDEQFGLGMFEDDDYSHRTRLAGYRVTCAEDAFVHHVGQAALNTLPPQELHALWEENQRRFERKWSVTWEPHSRRSEVVDRSDAAEQSRGSSVSS
jgi:GT2 family glycosyltransferase